MPSGNRSRDWLPNESTRAQESSNEDYAEGDGGDCAVCSSLDADEWSATGQRWAGGACEGGGKERQRYAGSASERAVRIHHLSSERESVRAGPQRSFFRGPSRSARGALRPGEELPNADVHLGSQAGGASGDSVEPGRGATARTQGFRRADLAGRSHR